MPSRQPGYGDPLGVLRHEYQELCESFFQLGWHAAVADANSPDFLLTVLSHSVRAKSVLFGHFFYDLQFVAAGLAAMALADAVPAKIVPYIADHPVAPFMASRISNLPRGSLCFIFDLDFADQIRFLNPNVTSFSHLPGLIFGIRELPQIKFFDRRFDCVVAVRYKATHIPDDLMQILENRVYGEALLETEALLIEDASLPLFGTFRSVIEKSQKCNLVDLARNDGKIFLRAMKALHYIDFSVRNIRRERMIRSLLSKKGKARVCIVGRPTEAMWHLLDDNVEIVPEMGFYELMRLYADARMVVHSQPTYPHALHERFLNAAALGCVVITERTPAYRTHFLEGKEWIPFSTSLSLADLCQCDRNDLQLIGEQARAKAWLNFSADAHARRIIEALKMQQ